MLRVYPVLIIFSMVLAGCQRNAAELEAFYKPTSVDFLCDIFTGVRADSDQYRTAKSELIRRGIDPSSCIN